MVRSVRKREPVPAPREDTIRHEMILLLQRQPMTVREISVQLGIGERDVYPHLQHIRLSLQRGVGRLRLFPAVCHGCGFVFHKRERLKKPGRCPLCRGESIELPQYAIE